VKPSFINLVRPNSIMSDVIVFMVHINDGMIGRVVHLIVRLSLAW